MESAQKAFQAGERLRRFRFRRGLSTREVANLSRVVAAEQGDEEFAISHARLTQIENEGSVPSIFKLFTLSAIYGIPMNDMLSSYVELPALGRLHHSMNAASTHALVPDDPPANGKTLPFPIRFDPSVPVEKTNLLSRMVEAWGEVPLAFLEQLNPRRYRYAWIGLSDYRMYPLIRPGSFVQIDECQRVLQPAEYRTEYDRPMFFVELRSGYLCSWCEVGKGWLISIPHPLSPCRAQQFAFPSEAEIIGRVTGVAVRLVNDMRTQARGKNEVTDVDSGDAMCSSAGRGRRLLTPGISKAANCMLAANGTAPTGCPRTAIVPEGIPNSR